MAYLDTPHLNYTFNRPATGGGSKARRLVVPALMAVIGFSSAYAQTASSPVEAAPAVSSSSVATEPLAAGPLGWKLLGKHIYALPGSDGLYHVAYSLVFTNEFSGAVTINSVQVVDPDNNFQPTGSNVMLAGDNTNIAGQVREFALPQTLDGSNFSTKLGPGQAGLMYFNVTYPNRGAVPAHLSHRVTSSAVVGGQTFSFVVTDDPIAVDRSEPLVLHPPLRGNGWLNSNGCCKNLGPHRGSFNAINGVFWQAETFAIDFVAVNQDGVGHTGDGSQVDQYFYYGADILAAKGGKVVEVVTDMPDQIPNPNPPATTIEDAAGNHVIVEMAPNRYALYAHLIPYSATVQVGDIVQTGQKLGLLGNSGNTTNPHLHFQVMDKPSALKADGVPFVFDSYTLAGRVTDSIDKAGELFFEGTPLPIQKIGAPECNTLDLALDAVNFQ